MDRLDRRQSASATDTAPREQPARRAAVADRVPICEAERASEVSRASEALPVSEARDVTRERQLEEELQESQKMEAVGRLAGGIAHDFNNLLTAISGFSELASLETQPDSELAGYLNEIRRSADRAITLTRQLLAFSRKSFLFPEALDLNAVLADVTPMLQRLIDESVTLVVLPGKNLGRVWSDRSQLEQVIVDLAANARDAMPRGGRLTIATANFELREPEAELPAGDYVRLTISDTGAGMDEETLGHIFEPFFTTRSPGRGAGLALAAVDGIVRQSRGRVAVESKPGRGSSFMIDLPAVKAEPTPARRATTGPLRRSARGTILLVEDEPTVLRFAFRLLSRSGFAVLTASNGKEAVELARTHRGEIDVLFTDMVMPGLSGRETAVAVEAIRPSIRTLFTSGYSEEVTREGGLEAGLRFIGKPYSVEALLQALDQTLSDSVPPKETAAG